MRLRSDGRCWVNPSLWYPPQVRRTDRDVERKKRRREFWFDACRLFLDLQEARMSIDGERAVLSNRALRTILPALYRAVGGEKAGMEPPPPRWFRYQIRSMQQDG
ncbi:hypothetical protein ACCT20_36540, partial [Rhizobium ruizarguesonis]